MHEPVRRIGLLGDVHGDSIRLEVALGWMHSKVELDAVVCVGDVVNLEADADGCCRLLGEANVLVVRGNHDRWFVENMGSYLRDIEREDGLSLPSRAYISALPAVREIETVSGLALLCHGLGEDDMLGIYPGEVIQSPAAEMVLWKIQVMGRYRWIINGHTHRRMVREFDGLTIINAGTVGADPVSGFAVIDFEALEVQFYNLDDNLAVYKSARCELT